MDWLEVWRKKQEIKKKMEVEIEPIKKKYHAEMDDLIIGHIDFKIGDRLYYPCDGSGYYGIYKGFVNGNLTMDITTKGGRLTGEIFRTSWCDHNRFSILKQGEK